MSSNLILIFYIVSAILFIVGIKRLGKVNTARQGNFLSALGMLIAIIATMFKMDAIPLEWVIGGILLGGIISLNSTEDKIKFGLSSDRMLNTIQLYHSKRINKIIISGASGSLKSDLIESDYLKKYLLTIGIPKNDIICERNSQNTYQNAQYTANYILKNNINSEAKCLLITSDYHQRRALACFKKANLNVDPYIIKLEEKYIYWDTYFIPQSSVLFKWRILMHEIIGYITYKTNNYI
jgi:uncharacterized SAM-binding protein YcdF (DUF218 family)